MNTEYGLGEIDEEEYDEEEIIGVSLKKTLPNTIITIIYFGFIVNAIVKKLSDSGQSNLQTKSNTSSGEHYKALAKNLSKQFSVTVYMAIFIVLINVFSTGYIYYFCEDRNTDTLMRSIIISQYNIVIITVIGVITYIVMKNNK